MILRSRKITFIFISEIISKWLFNRHNICWISILLFVWCIGRVMIRSILRINMLTLNILIAVLVPLFMVIMYFSVDIMKCLINWKEGDSHYVIVQKHGISGKPATCLVSHKISKTFGNRFSGIKVEPSSRRSYLQIKRIQSKLVCRNILKSPNICTFNQTSDMNMNIKDYFGCRIFAQMVKRWRRRFCN